MTKEQQIKATLEETTGLEVANISQRGDEYVINAYYLGETYVPPVGFELRGVGVLENKIFVIIQTKISE